MEYEEGFDQQDECSAVIVQYLDGKFCPFCHHKHITFLNIQDASHTNGVEMCSGCVLVAHNRWCDDAIPKLVSSGELNVYEYRGVSILADAGLEGIELESLFNGILTPVPPFTDQAQVIVHGPVELGPPPRPSTLHESEDDMEPVDVPTNIADEIRAILEKKNF